MIDIHPEEVDVELSCPREIFDVEDYMIDAGNLKCRFHITPPGLGILRSRFKVQGSTYARISVRIAVLVALT
jgi:hypothetical protein